MISFPLKAAYTFFVLLLVPVYWYFYGPTNFLYFCDIALLLTLVGVWRESAFLVSACSVGILGPQLLWVVDFCFALAGGSLTGMTAYMFSESPLFLRGLSLYHGWLPFLLLYLVWRLGYDRRAFLFWTLLTWVLLPVCFFWLPPPQADPGLTPVNINYVWGFSDLAPQSWVPPMVWLGGLLLGLPLLVYWPTDFLLRRFFRRA